MFNATCLIKTDIDTVNKCMGQNPYYHVSARYVLHHHLEASGNPHLR